MCSSQTWSQKMYFEKSVVWDKMNWNVQKNYETCPVYILWCKTVLWVISGWNNKSQLLFVYMRWNCVFLSSILTLSKETSLLKMHFAVSQGTTILKPRTLHVTPLCSLLKNQSGLSTLGFQRWGTTLSRKKLFSQKANSFPQDLFHMERETNASSSEWSPFEI